MERGAITDAMNILQSCKADVGYRMLHEHTDRRNNLRSLYWKLERAQVYLLNQRGELPAGR